MNAFMEPRGSLPHAIYINTEHFAEAFIEGREFHLALLERISGVEVLPIAEIVFGGLEAHAPEIYGYDAKWTPDSAAYVGTLRRFGLEQQEPELAKMLRQFALATWTLFDFTGYARVDFRVDASGAPFIIDVNPNLGRGRRGRSGRCWTLLLGLNRQHSRELACIS